MPKSDLLKYLKFDPEFIDYLRHAGLKEGI